MVAKLYIHEPDGSREIALDESPISIGRIESCSVQINEKKASKEHCTLEKEGGSWRLVDNMSSNGTMVNGKQINTKLLDEGDIIVIGKTEIHFGSPKPTAKPKAKKKADRAKKETERSKKVANREKRGTSREQKVVEPPKPKVKVKKVAVVDPRAAEKRQMEKIKTFSIIGAIVLVLLIIGNNLYQESVRQGEAASLSNRALKLSKTSKESKEYLKKLERSVELYQELESYFSDTPYGAKAGTQLEKLTALIESEKNAERAFKQLQEIAKSRSLKISLLEQKNRYQEILRRYPNSRIALNVQLEINGLREEMIQEAKIEFEGIERIVDSFLENQEYGAAFASIDDLIAKYENEEALKSLANEIISKRTLAETKAKNSLESYVERIDRAFGNRNFALAKDLIQEASHNFRGTVFQTEIKVRETTLSMVSDKKMDVKTAQVEAQKREKFYQLTQVSDAHLKSGRYREAYAEMKKLLNHPELEQLPDEKDKLLTQVDDLSKIVALLDKLNDKITSAEGLVSRTVYKGKKVRLYNVDERGLWIELEGGQARSQKRWTDMSAEDYYSLFLELKPAPQERLSIATYCFESQMIKKAHKQMIEAVKKNSGLKDYADLLFARKTNQNIPDGGFVIFDREFMRPEEKDRSIIRKDTKKLLASLGSGNSESRKEKMNELTTLLTEAAGKHGDEFVTDLKSGIIEELKAKRIKFLKSLAQSNAFRDVGTLRELKKELNARRVTALKLIRDTVKYPYPYFKSAVEQKKVQDEVDDLVAKVEEIWDRPFDNVAQINPAIAQVTNRIKEMETQLKTFDPNFNPEDEGGLNLNYIAALAGESLNIQNFGLDKKEQDLVAYNKEVFDYNKRVVTNASGIERKQIRITNEYRNMIGEHCVRVNDELTTAARNHSQYMATSGVFAHVIPGHPFGETPADRCRKAGYKSGGISENCHMGSSDPLSAHIGWCHSSGHHRNIVAAGWRALGVGVSGKYWTQNFGSDIGTAREKAEKLGNKKLPEEKDKESKKGNMGKGGGTTGGKKGGSSGGGAVTTGGGSSGGGSTGSRPTKNSEENH